MKRFTALLLTGLLLLSLIACGAKGAWQEQYDLGMRYLNEGNYQEAVIAFEAAIEIDPKRPEAYLGAAEAYMGLGDTDSARRVLEDGISNCENADGLLERLDELNSGGRDFAGWDLLAAGDQGNLITLDDVTCLGHSVMGLDISTVSSLIHQNGLKYDENSDEDHYWVQGRAADYAGASISALQYKSENYVCLWGYDHYYYEDGDGGPTLPIGLRGINTHDSLVTVMTKLGFTNGQDIADYAYELMDQEYADGEESPFGLRLSGMRYEGIQFGQRGTAEQTESGLWRAISLQFSWYFNGSDGMTYCLSFEFEHDQLTNYDVSCY